MSCGNQTEQEPPLKLQETTEQPDAEDGAPQLLACQLIGCPLLIWSVSFAGNVLLRTLIYWPQEIGTP